MDRLLAFSAIDHINAITRLICDQYSQAIEERAVIMGAVPVRLCHKELQHIVSHIKYIGMPFLLALWFNSIRLVELQFSVG